MSLRVLQRLYVSVQKRARVRSPKLSCDLEVYSNSVQRSYRLARQRSFSNCSDYWWRQQVHLLKQAQAERGFAILPRDSGEARDFFRLAGLCPGPGWRDIRAPRGRSVLARMPVRADSYGPWPCRMPAIPTKLALQCNRRLLARSGAVVQCRQRAANARSTADRRLGRHGAMIISRSFGHQRGIHERIAVPPARHGIGRLGSVHRIIVILIRKISSF
jgi:hypothetical protein